jgi:hypothetical protein
MNTLGGDVLARYQTTLRGFARSCGTFAVVGAVGCQSPMAPPAPPTAQAQYFEPSAQAVIPVSNEVEPSKQTLGSGAAVGTPNSITSLVDGANCLAATDCTSGVCEGQGCDAGKPGVCVAASRGCTRDLRQYCGCDGVVFQASGSCPAKRFASRGACADVK